MTKYFHKTKDLQLVEVYTDLPGNKKSHKQVDVDRMIAPRSHGGEMVITLALE